MQAVMVAGTDSGVGKTTISLGLMAALKQKRFLVNPFKVGPDYIDPGFHRLACERPSHNLDSWLLSPENLKYLWQKANSNDGIAVVEGVMGFYDGVSAINDQGSSAEIASLLNIPVLLVIDGSGMARSAAALVQGYKNFNSDVNLAGVIVNKVGSEGHFDLISQAIEKETGLPTVGYLKKGLDFELPSRHLGLVPAAEIPAIKEKIASLGQKIKDNFQLSKIRNISSEAGEVSLPENFARPLNDINISTKGTGKNNLRIGIARDKAFSFYYQANLDLLKEAGCELVEFSPLKDKCLPDNLSGIYLAGGFPEEFARELEENRSFKEDLKSKLQNGLPAFAECGGFMYLLEKVYITETEYYQMTGFLPASSIMTERLQNFGYLTIDFSWGLKIKGHEFHYSKLINDDKLTYGAELEYARRKICRSGFVIKNNLLAGYPHLHFYSNPEFVNTWLKLCQGEISSWQKI